MIPTSLAAALRSHRSHEKWTWDMLDNDDNFIGEFPGVTGGSLTMNVFADIKNGGTFAWKGRVQPQWLGFRIRPIYHATLIDGTQIEWPFGIYIPSTPEPEYNGMSIAASVEFYDKTLVLSEDAVFSTFTLPAGALVTQEITNLIAGAGETMYSIVDSTLRLVNPVVWKAGTSKLRIINDLLETINYFSLYCDTAGYFRVEPYVAPEYRGSMWDFVHGEHSIYQPRFSNKQDYFGKPNRMVLLSQGSGDEEGMTATATNVQSPDKPLDPLAYGGLRGTRWVTATEEGVEATSQAVLNDLARRRLNSLSEVSSTFEFKHALVLLDLNGIVTFQNSREGFDTKGVVQTMEIPCVTGKAAQVSTLIREVKA